MHTLTQLCDNNYTTITRYGHKSEEHYDLRFHYCNFSTKRFSTLSSLLAHMQIHAGQHQFRGRTNNQIINRSDL